MNIYQRIMAWRNKPGPGITAPPPKQGYKRFLFLFGTHFFKLMRINLLFIAFSIPIITIPAAYLGMTRVMMNLVHEGNCFIWNDFWTEFKLSFIKGVLIGIFSCAIIFIFYYIPSSMGFTWLSIGIFFGIGFIILLILSYAFPLFTIVNLKTSTNLRNACALFSIAWKRTLLLTIFLILFWLPVIWFIPYSIPIILFLWFSVGQLAVCTIVYTPIRVYIIEPYILKSK